jgi:hypothetical protein
MQQRPFLGWRILLRVSNFHLNDLSCFTDALPPWINCSSHVNVRDLRLHTLAGKGTNLLSVIMYVSGFWQAPDIYFHFWA